MGRSGVSQLEGSIGCGGKARAVVWRRRWRWRWWAFLASVLRSLRTRAPVERAVWTPMLQVPPRELRRWWLGARVASRRTWRSPGVHRRRQSPQASSSWAPRPRRLWAPPRRRSPSASGRQPAAPRRRAPSAARALSPLLPEPHPSGPWPSASGAPWRRLSLRARAPTSAAWAPPSPRPWKPRRWRRRRSWRSCQTSAAEARCPWLGLGDEVRERKKPTIVRGLVSVRVCVVTVGTPHGVCTTTSGRLYSWGASRTP